LAPAARADRVDDYINRQLQRRHIPGLSLAVIENGKIVKAKGYGLANLETKTPATADTVYKIGSVSKQFIAAGIMLLVQDGKLSVDDRIGKFLPVPTAWADITVRNLLTHTSGFVEDPPGFEPFATQTEAEILTLAATKPLLSPPGEKCSYSNLGYFALAEIIFQVSGKPWGTFLTDRVFRPTGMVATRTTTTTELVPGRANGYTTKDERVVNAENWVAVRPSGAFLSTVTDMAKWDLALYTDNVLTPKSKEAMWTPLTLRDGSRVPYGFGWSVNPWMGHRMISHNGNLPGFNSEFDRFPDDKLSVVVLVNTDRADPGAIARKVAGMYRSALAMNPVPDPEPAVSAKIRQVIEGLIRGHTDPNLLVPHLAQFLAEGSEAKYMKLLNEPGPVRSVKLVGRDGQGHYAFRIAYAKDNLLFRCILDAEHRVVDFGVEED